MHGLLTLTSHAAKKLLSETILFYSNFQTLLRRVNIRKRSYKSQKDAPERSRKMAYGQPRDSAVDYLDGLDAEDVLEIDSSGGNGIAQDTSCEISNQSGSLRHGIGHEYIYVPSPLMESYSSRCFPMSLFSTEVGIRETDASSPSSNQLDNIGCPNTESSESPIDLDELIGSQHFLGDVIFESNQGDRVEKNVHLKMLKKFL
jgi:hypothetical protein